MIKEEEIKKVEPVKKDCVRKDHNGFQILAVDLSDEYTKENEQKKYLCVKCLLEKIGNKKIVLYNDAIDKLAEANQKLKQNTVEKQQEIFQSLQKLQVVIKSTEGGFSKLFEDLKQLLELHINKEQQKLEKVQDLNQNEDMKLLSSCYQEDGKLASPNPNIDFKEMAGFLTFFKQIFQQLEQSEQIQDVNKEVSKIESVCQVNLQLDQQLKKTPALDMVCENHKLEIIMFNLNQTLFEQTNPFLCVDCLEDLQNKGNKASSNTISLKKTVAKWNDYIKDQIDKRSQRQSRLNQAIGFIKKLQEKYNQELNKMILSLNEQLKKQPKEYEQLMKLNNTHIFNQDKQNLLEIIKILGQTDQQKNQEYISNQEDSVFYESLKKGLEELIKENLVVENQIQWFQHFDKLPKKINDSENESEVVEFLKKSTIQDLYLSFFDISFKSLSSFKKEEQDLKQKGKLQKLQQTDSENYNETLQNQQRWYQQFQESQAKLERFKKVDELQNSQKQYEELLQQEQENKQKLKDLEIVTENQKKHLEQAQIKFQDINLVYEQITELKQIYKIKDHSLIKGDTELLSQEYAQKIYKYIEQQNNRKIKNKYLMYSSKKSGLNSNTFVNSIDKMSNLLMIFKSKSQSIFGGFSPCQWLKCSTNYQADETLASFLFSQTQGDIYAINPTNSSCAIIMNNSEIGFGYQDMKIDYINFQNGSSYLGSTYTIPANSPNYSAQNLLFGSPKPNIIDIEIIMLTFV